MELEYYVKIVMNILLGLKNECKKYECCTTKCHFYEHNTGSCLLKECPCDYDISEIEKAISHIIDIEMKKEGAENE